MFGGLLANVFFSTKMAEKSVTFRRLAIITDLLHGAESLKS